MDITDVITTYIMHIFSFFFVTADCRIILTFFLVGWFFFFEYCYLCQQSIGLNICAALDLLYCMIGNILLYALVHNVLCSFNHCSFEISQIHGILLFLCLKPQKLHPKTNFDTSILYMTVSLGFLVMVDLISFSFFQCIYFFC